MKRFWQKIVWFILLLLSIFFTIWKVITIKDKPFNKVELEYNNFIMNLTDMKYLDTILHIGLNQLNIRGVQIQIRLLTKDVSPPMKDDVEYKAILQDFDKKYILWVSNTKRNGSFIIMGHELVHLKQYYNGELLIKDNIPIWKGNVFDINSVDYFNRPWEIEAFSNEALISKNIKKMLYE